jgi:hypothetical protein
MSKKKAIRKTGREREREREIDREQSFKKRRKRINALQSNLNFN